MSPTSATVWAALQRTIRRVRRDAVMTVVLTVVAVAPAVLLVGWAVGDGWSIRGGGGPLLLLAAGACAAGGLALVLAGRWIRPVTDSAVVAAAERRRALSEGSLRGVVELARGLPAGSSAALFRRSEAALAVRLEGASADELAGDLGERVRYRRRRVTATLSGLVLLTAAAGFATPERARAGWAPLLHPVEHLRGPVLPGLAVRPGDVDVPRGEMLRLEVDAPLRSRVAVEWRAAGDVPRTITVEVAEGRGAGSIGPVTGPLQYRVRAPDGAVSPLYRVTPIDPLLLAGFSLEVVYPAHVGREPEQIDGEPPPLEVPDGTVLRLRGAATRPLAAAALRRADGAERRPSTTGSVFQLDWRVDLASSGRWEIGLRDEAGATAVAAAPLDLLVTPDAPPRVRITVPGVDTTLAPSLRQQVVADASDDYGIAAAELVFRRLTQTGERGPVIRTPLPIDPGADRIMIRALLDASAEPLVPGDAIEYHVVVRDNSPSGQTGRSGTYLLRLPGRAELRAQARTEAARLLDDAARLAERTRELETATRNLSRRAAGQGRSGQAGGSPGSRSEAEPPPLRYEQASEVQQLAEAHEAALSAIEDLRDRVAELQRAIEEAGLQDPELRRQLDELRDLYRQLATPEARREAERVRDAAENLDPAAVQEALSRLMEQQAEIRKAVEESLERMRRAAAEQEMNTLAREAEEIASQQQALAEAMRDQLGSGADAEAREPGTAGEAGDPADGAPVEEEGAEGAAGAEEAEGADADDAAGGEQDSGASPSEQAAGLAEEQESLQDRAEQLNQSLESLQQQLMQTGDSESASQAGAAQEKGQSAQQSMQDAAEQARQEQGDQAGDSGQQAAGDMADAARTLDAARDRMAGARKQQAQEAVQQAAQEALQLAEREESLRQEMEQAQQGGQAGGQQGEALQEMQSEQAAVQQGLQQLGRNLAEASRESGLVNRDVAQALARAMLNMDETIEGLRDGGRMPVAQAGRTVEALNQLALTLLENDAQIARPRGGASDEVFRQLAELARAQDQVNMQTGALAPMDLTTRAMMQQLEELAQQQRGIARRVGDVSNMLGGREDVTGRLDQLSSEAAEIASELEGGRLEAAVLARQDRLFHRLLDAGRTLEREEYSDERVGEVAGARAATRPDALDPALLDAGLRYAVPTAEQLRRLPPAYRRLILEYFDRLNHGEPAGVPAGSREVRP